MGPLGDESAERVLRFIWHLLEFPNLSLQDVANMAYYFTNDNQSFSKLYKGIFQVFPRLQPLNFYPRISLCLLLETAQGRFIDSQLSYLPCTHGACGSLWASVNQVTQQLKEAWSLPHCSVCFDRAASRLTGVQSKRQLTFKIPNCPQTC